MRPLQQREALGDWALWYGEATGLCCTPSVPLLC
jgi:hypothetical protein